MLSLRQSIPMMTAFVQGLLSFFSPCVLPLLPVYLSYLGGSHGTANEGNTVLNRRVILVNTLFFVLGISFTLMLLGTAFSAAGQFLQAHRKTVSLITGGIVVLFGLMQLGLLSRGSFFQREFRLPFHPERLGMSPLTALLMGLCFSFSWTPCVGPVLSGILMTVAAEGTRGRGVILMAAYILGFVLPFLGVGLFTGGLMAFFRKKRAVVRWTGLISGLLLVAMGVLIMTGAMADWSSMLASASAEEEAAAEDTLMAPDFTLKDQFGEEHTLSEYRGKTVFLNFWATWCPWCVKEMPDIEQLYHETGENQGNLIILGMAGPGSVDQADEAGVADFLKEKGLTYPTLMDPTGEQFAIYAASALPTSWLIAADGQPIGYVPGALSRENIVELLSAYAPEALEQTPRTNE